MTVEQRMHLWERWETVRTELQEGIYRPIPVKRVEIPKPRGGVRLLGIPTIMDRFIQQALLQVMTPIFDPHFSPHSFGFRPGEAVKQAQSYIQEGFRWVIDMDLEKFFDRVNHDLLIARVARKVSDKHILMLISYAGVMVDGGFVADCECVYGSNGNCRELDWGTYAP